VQREVGVELGERGAQLRDDRVRVATPVHDDPHVVEVRLGGRRQLIERVVHLELHRRGVGRRVHDVVDDADDLDARLLAEAVDEALADRVLTAAP
jgi:hypothetical protein